MSLLTLSARRLATTFRASTCPQWRQLSSSPYALAKGPKMSQVDVDEPSVQQELGKMQMDFVKKAEQSSAHRAQLHKKFRRKDWTIAGLCFAFAGSIYAYTMYAIKQERFLDDFNMPDPMDLKESKNVEIPKIK